jgi:hypothetical protein
MCELRAVSMDTHTTRDHVTTTSNILRWPFHFQNAMNHETHLETCVIDQRFDPFSNARSDCLPDTDLGEVRVLISTNRLTA